MDWFCPVSFKGLYFLMSGLAAGQGHLVERTWALEAASPWFIFCFFFFFLFPINWMTLGKFFSPSEPVSSFR